MAAAKARRRISMRESAQSRGDLLSDTFESMTLRGKVRRFDQSGATVGHGSSSPQVRVRPRPRQIPESPCLPLIPSHWFQQNLRLWNKSKVATWLYSVRLGQFSRNFQNQEIDGGHLRFLTTQNLVDLGLDKIGYRLTFEKELARLERLCEQRS